MRSFLEALPPKRESVYQGLFKPYTETPLSVLAGLLIIHLKALLRGNFSELCLWPLEDRYNAYQASKF